jgi:hypothetical protein
MCEASEICCSDKQYKVNNNYWCVKNLNEQWHFWQNDKLASGTKCLTCQKNTDIVTLKILSGESTRIIQYVILMFTLVTGFFEKSSFCLFGYMKWNVTA